MTSRSEDRERDDIAGALADEQVAAHREVCERLAHALDRGPVPACSASEVVWATCAGMGEDEGEQASAERAVVHDADRPTTPAGLHLSDIARARAAVVCVLERHPSRCGDDAEDREVLADALLEALRLTELQLDHEPMMTRTDAREE